jgi:hypothetical protein
VRIVTTMGLAAWTARLLERWVARWQRPDASG